MGFPMVQDPEGMTRLEGVIVGFSHNAGWGFISCPEVSATYGKDCFFHVKDCGGINPSKGQSVSFLLQEDEKTGKPHAKSILFDMNQATSMASNSFKLAGMSMGGKAPTAAQVGGPRYTGTVLSYTNQTGWGFITCPEVQAAYGKDVFFHLKDIAGVYSVAKGDMLSFCLDDQVTGKPQASQIQLIGKTDAPGAVRYEGTVTGFTQSTGWGFIACPKLKQVFQKDVFFHQKDCSGGAVSKGLQVSFLLEEESTQTGKPKATAVMVPEGAPPPMMPLGPGSAGATQVQSALTGLAPFGLGGGAPQGIGGGVDLATVLTVVQATGAQLSGTVQSFSDPPGWGFLECPALGLQPGKGIFFHVKDCNGMGPDRLQQGAAVTFSVSNGPSGRLQASNVQPGTSAGQFQLKQTPQQQLQAQQQVIQQQQMQLQMLQKRSNSNMIGGSVKRARGVGFV